MLYYSSVYYQTNKELSLVLHQQNESGKVGCQYHCLSRTDSEYVILTFRNKKKKRQNSISQKQNKTKHYFGEFYKAENVPSQLYVLTGPFKEPKKY